MIARKILLMLALTMNATHADDLRLGIIGTDTSHVIAFTQVLNDATRKNHVAGARVVAAFKGGSVDIEASRSRVDKFADQLQKDFGVKIVGSIDELCAQVDAVLLESVDGRPHLAQARPVIAARKPLFIDKPVAGSLRDAVEIFRLAKEANVPCFSSSSLRFYESLAELKRADVGEIRAAISVGPCEIEPHHPDLFWYGIHATEALFAAIGTGCETVSRTHTADSDVVTGVWRDGRVGTVIGLRTKSSPYRLTLFGTKSTADQKGDGDYTPLVREIVKFFQSGIAPVSPEETLEIFAFMEAADESKRLGGKPVAIKDVLKKAGSGK